MADRKKTTTIVRVPSAFNAPRLQAGGFQTEYDGIVAVGAVIGADACLISWRPETPGPPNPYSQAACRWASAC